jgi:tetratricopeptide (TPR) repeat protein
MHVGLGVAYKQTGDYELARTHYTAALRLAEAIGHGPLASSCNINLGGLCVNEGDPATGIEHMRAALAYPEHVSQPHIAVALYINYGCALLDLDNLVEAAEALTKALDVALQTDDLQRACYAHHSLAEVSLRRSHADDARLHADAEVHLARRCGDPLRLAAAFDMLASTICHSDRQTARQHWQEAQTLYQELNHRLAEPLAVWLNTLETLDAEALSRADSVRRQKARKLH